MSSTFSGLVAHVGKSTDHGDPRTITRLDNGKLPLQVRAVDGRLVGRIDVVARVGTEVRVYGEIDWPTGEYFVAPRISGIGMPNGVVGDLTGTLAAMTVLAVTQPGDSDFGPMWDDAKIHVS